MGEVERVLPRQAFAGLDEYIESGGGVGLRAARSLPPETVIDEIEASGLRGRGGAGYPAGRKWRTVRANQSALERSTVVVNAAEGEPGSFKDRAILRRSPYAVLEGALIAAHAVGARQVIVAMRKTFEVEAARVDTAIGELEAAGWAEDGDISIFQGPEEYLFGEETALLESIDGRYPFPRIAPPFRRGVNEIVESAQDVDSDSASAAHVEMAGPESDTIAPPTLASSTESFANVPGILSNGAEWFRSIGTPESPGTIVCTVTGSCRRHGVAEMAMGTPLREAIEKIGGGALPGRRIVAVMSGVANALVAEPNLDTPLSYEALAAVGSGLGAGGFIVFDDMTDFAALAAGVARFLAVESCGQCARCKQDGLELSEHFGHISRSEADPHDLDRVGELLSTVADGARCNLASQQQIVLGSILERFPDDIDAHLLRQSPAREPELIAAIVELDDEHGTIDQRQRDKQPDWTFDPEYSGKWPADRLDNQREHNQL